MGSINLLAAAVSGGIATAAFAQSPRLVMEEMMVNSEPGIEIFVRNKRPADMTAFRPERTCVYVHGATYPASPRSTSSSMASPGWSTSRRAATTSICSTCAATANRRGRRKWRRTAENNPPIVRGDTAVKDIGTVVDFVRTRRNIPRVNLIGWSWGTTLMATYTTQNPARSSGWCSTLRRGSAPRLRWCRPGPARSAPIARCRATRRWRAGSPACRRTRRRRSSRPAGSTPGPTPPWQPIRKAPR